MKAKTTKLTSNDTRALWHAVQGLHELVCAMRSESFSAAQIAAERSRVLAARQALRKVNAIRKAQSCRRSTTLQVVQEHQQGAGGA